MNSPKFTVGETVILQSVSYPQYNGEYTVDRVLCTGEIFIDRICGEESISLWRIWLLFILT